MEAIAREASPSLRCATHRITAAFLKHTTRVFLFVFHNTFFFRFSENAKNLEIKPDDEGSAPQRISR
jgi:hypothetical protein